MPKTEFAGHNIIHGFRPGAEPRFYFFLIQKDRERVAKHCVWAKRESPLAQEQLPKSELADKFIELGIGRAMEKIDKGEHSNTLLVVDKDRQYEIDLETLEDKLVFDW